MVRGGKGGVFMILSHADIEEIAAAVTVDFNRFFFGTEANETNRMPQGTPIDQFAREYLNLDVSIEKLSSDGSLCGLTAYEDTEYVIEEDGVTRTIPLKRNQVLLDSSFVAPGNVRKLCGKRRFTLAHECAHQILFQLESDETKAACRKLYAERRTYSLRELKSNEDWNEWQANVLGAAILMPQTEIDLAMQCFASSGQIQNYEGWLHQKDRVLVDMMCGTFGVSKSALLIRLRHLGYLIDRLCSEYWEPWEVRA